jgi:hypothetical protein
MIYRDGSMLTGSAESYDEGLLGNVNQFIEFETIGRNGKRRVTLNPVARKFLDRHQELFDVVKDSQ